jgi:cytoskeleton protein RodZ
MSDEAIGQPAVPAASEMTAGALLRQAREASGLHVAALAVAMKVPVKKLEALEADRLQDLPDAVFVRALAASVCRTLKVDPTPILNKLPQTAAPRFEADDRGINAPFRSHGGYEGASFKSFLTKPAVLFVVVLLLGALALAFWPEARHVEPSAEAPAAAPTADAAPGVAASNEAAQVAVAPASVPLPAPNLVPEGVAAAAAIVAPAVAAPAKVASAPASQASSAASAIVKSGPMVIAFKVKAQAWVRVTDAKGAVQFEKTLQAGEAAAAGGELPLSVVVGNVSATEVELRGQPFSLDALNKNNVARFEVK